MPSPQVIPFPPDRFNQRSSAQDLATSESYSDHDEGATAMRQAHRQPRFHPPIACSELRPYSDLEALMVAPPGEEPEVSVESTFALRDRLEEAIGALTERERYIIEGLFYEHYSLRELGRVMSLSKDAIAKARDVATAKMFEFMEGVR